MRLIANAIGNIYYKYHLDIYAPQILYLIYLITLMF